MNLRKRPCVKSFTRPSAGARLASTNAVSPELFCAHPFAFAHNSLQLTRKKTPTSTNGMATRICNA
jgi:hypothetical protein